jgi:hypothetical protein
MIVKERPIVIKSFALAAVISVLAIASVPAFADCSLVPNGTTILTSETRPVGTVIYNLDYDVAQLCRADGHWVALGKIGSGLPPGPTGCDNVGETCSDGTIYAGLSPDGNEKMYAAAADALSTYAWGPTGVDTAMENCTTNNPGIQDSCSTGEANATLLAELGGTFASATYCEGLEAHGHDDWYLPSQNELDVIYDNLKSGQPAGTHGFQSAYYWSSSENNSGYAWGQHFTSGIQVNGSKANSYRVRCVRR